MGAGRECSRLIYLERLRSDGAQGRNRTTDTVIFSHVLYRLSYLGTGFRPRRFSSTEAFRRQE